MARTITRTRPRRGSLGLLIVIMAVSMSVSVVIVNVLVVLEEVGLERHVWAPPALPAPLLVFFPVRHGLVVW